MPKLRFLLLLIVALGLMLSFSACQKEAMQPDLLTFKESEKEEITIAAKPSRKPKKVTLAQHALLGQYLADQDGRALYISILDAAGNSSCLTRCLGIWPVFNLKNIKVSDGLSASDFVTITRPDGKLQTTYKGWPLYYFSGDIHAGDVNGDGIDKTRFVAKPELTPIPAD